MSKTQFSEQDMTREQWLPALACLSTVKLRNAVLPILENYDLEHQALPEDGLGLLQVQDGSWGQAFYLGEFPLASAHIILKTPQGREFSGAAQYLGDRKEKAVSMAVCDAVLANNLPEKQSVWELVSAGKKKREAIKRQRQAMISRTRVDFDLLSTDQGEHDAY
jgi:alpha-D-ribose 1-methylphosphonate 5-triphosphate synthase subunit PhnG